MYFSRYSSVLLLLIIFISVLYAIPNIIKNFNLKSFSSFLPGDQVNLGLDLKGGSYILLQAEMNTSVIEFLDKIVSSIRNDLRKKGIKYKSLTHKQSKISFVIRDSTLEKDTKKILNKYSNNFNVDNISNRFILEFSESGKVNFIHQL